MAQEYADVAYLYLAQRGRGRALKHAWLATDSDPRGLYGRGPLDESAGLPSPAQYLTLRLRRVATGSRLMPASRIRRSFRREALSQGYNLLIKALFWHHFSDAQCGFKALTRRAGGEAPAADRGTRAGSSTPSCLLLAEHLGYRIAEVPVEWVEDLDSRVRIIPTAVADIRGLLRMRRKLRTLPRQ